METHIIDTFDGNVMWFQERRLLFKGVPNITTDEWGVTIGFESENFRTLSISGRWDASISRSRELGAHFAGRTLSFDCPYPELGVSHGQNHRPTDFNVRVFGGLPFSDMSAKAPLPQHPSPIDYR